MFDCLLPFSQTWAKSVPHIFEGNSSATPGRFAIVVSRYNNSVTTRLLDAALETLAGAGVSDDDVDVAWVPGSFEIPPLALRMASNPDTLAVICLGAVIRGETTHDQHINRSMSHFLMEIGVRSGVPVLFGVLTCDTLEQALQRAGGAKGNKGAECAQAALEMASLLQQLPAPRR